MLKLSKTFSKFNFKYLTQPPSLLKNGNNFSIFAASSYNTAEVANFDNQAAGFWDPFGNGKILQQMNSVRVPFIRQALEKQRRGEKSHQIGKNGTTTQTANTAQTDFCQPLQDLNILDVGCGVGILAEPLARLGANIVAIDASENMISAAKTRQKNAAKYLKDSNLEDIQSIEYLNTTIEDLTEIEHLKGFFDLVVSSEVIEHIDVAERFSFLENLAHFCKKSGHNGQHGPDSGGSIILSTMSNTLKSYLVTILAGEKLLKIVPEGTHDINKYTSADDLSNLILTLNESQKIEAEAQSLPEDPVSTTLDQNGSNLSQTPKIKIERVEGLFYNPVTELWSFSDDLDVNYILQARFE